MLRLYVLILVLLLCPAVVACAKTDARPAVPAIRDVVAHQLSAEARFNKPPVELGSGRGIGFVRPEDRDTPRFERPQTEEFRMDVGQPFAPLLILTNGSDSPKTFLVTAILDYRQTVFQLDGKEGLLHELVVPPRTELEVPMLLAVGASGAHDLQVAAFDDPYNASLDINYRMDLSGKVIARRTAVIVGGDSTPARTPQKSFVGVSPPPEVSLGLWMAFAKASQGNSVHPSRRQLYVDSASNGQTYSFQIWASTHHFSKKRAVNYATMLFLDFHQVPLVGEDFVILHLDPDQEIIIDTDVKLPSASGVHQLQLIWVEDAYRSVLAKQVGSAFVLSSPRIAIETQ